MVIADIFAFASEKRFLKGEVFFKDCPRLKDVLESLEGSVFFELVGVDGKNRKNALRLTLNGVFALVCQRCLEHLDYTMQHTMVLELARENVQIPEDDFLMENYEIFPTAKTLDVAQLVEDEIILALPNFPRHDSCRSFDYGCSTK